MKVKTAIKNPMSQKKFLEALGDECPNCGGCDLAGDSEWNAGVVSRKVNCGTCNAEWVEFYNLSGYDGWVEFYNLAGYDNLTMTTKVEPMEEKS